MLPLTLGLNTALNVFGTAVFIVQISYANTLGQKMLFLSCNRQRQIDAGMFLEKTFVEQSNKLE